VTGVKRMLAYINKLQAGICYKCGMSARNTVWYRAAAVRLRNKAAEANDDTALQNSYLVD
jgi:hypothetical protein